MRTKSKKNTVILSIIPLLVSSLAGCSFAAPQATPTPTATPTLTDTPFPTSTPTKVPAPVTILGCLYADACVSAYPILDYFGKSDTLTYNIQYPMTVYTGSEVWFFYEWCSIDRVTLEKNLESMEFIFTIDNISYLEKIDQGNTSRQDQKKPSVSYPCHSIGGVLSGWQIGKPHKIVIGSILFADISDGWNTFPAGDYLDMYMINPTNVATQIPPTATPTPINTPKSEQPLDCGIMGTLYISNGSPGWLTVTITGTATYNFTVAPYTRKIACINTGSYDYAAQSTECSGTVYGTISGEGTFWIGVYCRPGG